MTLIESGKELEQNWGDFNQLLQKVEHEVF